MSKLIIANWKCNPPNLKEAESLFGAVEKGIWDIKKTEVVICPPSIYIFPLIGKLSRSSLGLKMGAQDCFWGERGACTGEISPLMLKDAGVRYVIVGHSERRKHHRETDEMINQKVQFALLAGLKVILCIDKIVQIEKDLKGITEEQLKKIIIAYEPIFAIGTGKPCNPKKAKKIRDAIKNVLKTTPVLYGGSVNSQNAESYVKEASFQGLLVGSASLDLKEFLAIVKNSAF